MLILTPIGLVCIITYTSIFKPLREFLSAHAESKMWSVPYHLINCSICLGFWCGIVTYWCMDFPLNEVICYGLSSAFLSSLSINLINYLKRK